MNKSDLIRRLSEKTNSTYKGSGNFLDAFIEAVKESLPKNGQISLVGFGSFSVTKRAARIARNFQTGKSINIPESKSIKFRPGKLLKDSVANT